VALALPLQVVTRKGLTAKQLGILELEAAICKRLDHPNISKLFDFFSDKKRDILVFEMIPVSAAGSLSMRPGVP